jgi:hypothetical protein
MFHATAQSGSAVPSTFSPIVLAFEAAIDTQLAFHLIDRTDPQRPEAMEACVEANITAEELANSYIDDNESVQNHDLYRMMAAQFVAVLRCDSIETTPYIEIFGTASKAALASPQDTQMSGELMHALTVLDAYIELQVAETDAMARSRSLN